MARYKEVWADYNEDTVTGYLDTEHTAGKRYLAPDSAEVAEWIGQGNTADPAFTAEEIAAHEAAEKDAEARAYLIETGPIITTFNDDITRKGRSKIKASKAARIARHRERARRRLLNPYPTYTR